MSSVDVTKGPDPVNEEVPKENHGGGEHLGAIVREVEVRHPDAQGQQPDRSGEEPGFTEEPAIGAVEDRCVDGETGYIYEEELDELAGQRLASRLWIDPKTIPDEIADYSGAEGESVREQLGERRELY